MPVVIAGPVAQAVRGALHGVGKHVVEVGALEFGEFGLEVVADVGADDELLQLAGHRPGQADVHDGAVGAVLLAEDRGLLVQAGDDVAAVEGDAHGDVRVHRVEHQLDSGLQLGDALTGGGGGEHHVVEDVAQLRDGGGLGQVDLVDHQQLRRHLRALLAGDVGDDVVDRADLLQRERVRTVDDVQDEVRLEDFLQGRTERLDQLRRQVADEADGVGHDDRPAVAQLTAARRRIQGGEKRVLHQHACARQRVEQRGLAGVGVTRDGDARQMPRPAPRPLDFAGGLHRRQLLADARHVLAQATAVGLDLRFARATQADAAVRTGAATGLAGQRMAPTAQTRDQVLHLGQRHLRLALLRLRVLRENVEDEHGAVDDLGVELVLQRDQLAGREFTVGDDGVGAGGLHDVAQLRHLA